jgi:glucosylceramidase
MTEIYAIVTTALNLKEKWSPILGLKWHSDPIPSIQKSNSIMCKIDSNQFEFNHPYLGFGYSFEHTSCQNLMFMPEVERHKALEALVDPQKGIGMNLWRLCIGTPDFYGFDQKFGGFGYWYSYVDPPPLDAEDPINHVDQKFSIEKDRRFIIPVVKEALQINPNIRLFASPWSPPGWMKDSGLMCGGKLLPKMRAAYARYLVKFIEEYEKEGLKIIALTVQNEPYHNWPPKKVKNKQGKLELKGGMPSCFWRAYEERDFIRDFLGPAIKSAKLNTEIWCYDHNWDDIPGRAARYPHIVLNDPQAAQYVSGIGFHHYSALGWSNPKLMIKHRKMAAKDVPFYFTEGSLSWTAKGAPKFFSGYMVLRLVRYLRYGSSSYNGWVPILDTEGNPNDGPFKAKESIIQRDAQTNTLIINNDYYWHGHFSKYIQRGAYCIHIEKPSWKDLEMIAYLNPDKSIVLILVSKAWDNRKCTIHWNSNFVDIDVPAQSIITMSWKTSKCLSLS